jgi:co-chaperonin GroES (HSP10)
MILTQDKILLEIAEEKTTGGIFIPEKKQGTRSFKVVAVGPGRYNPMTGNFKPVQVKVGDRVVVDTTVAPEISIVKNGVKSKYYIIPEKEIQYILEDGED